MSTKFLSPGWRMPRNANQSKSSNYSMDFDSASSDYIDCGNNFNFGDGTNDSPFSISAWINMTSTSGFRILNRYNGGNLEYSFGTGGGNKLQFFIFDDITKYRAIVMTTVLNTGQWYHVAATYSGVGGQDAQDGMIIYVDGVPATVTETIVGAYQAMPNLPIDAYIGKLDTSYANGKIDAVAIYNYELSQDQVTTLYGTGSAIGNPMALPSPPIAYYPLGTSAWNGQYLAENNAIGDYVFDFVPSDDVINISNNSAFNLGTSFTISGWFNFDTYKYQGLISFDSSSTRGWFLFQFTNADILLFDGTTSYTLKSSYTTTNQWDNFIVTYDGADLVFYINGVQESTQAVSVNLQTNGNDGQIGNNQFNTGRYFNGSISNVQVFNTALSSTEAETLYNYGSPIRTLANIPQSSNLKAWYKLDASEVYNNTTTEWSIDNNQNPSAYASSLDFDGTADYIQIPNLSTINTSGNVSISFWMKTSNTTTTQSPVRLQGDTIGFYMYPDGLVRMYGSSTGRLDSSIASNDGEWHLVVGVYGTSAQKLYIDNVVTASDVGFQGNIGTTGGAIGSRYFSSANTLFEGQISNCSVWNTALTSSQVTEIYNNGTPSNLSSHSATSNLISWWKLNNTTTGIEDAKGSNNGTNNGATEYAGFVNTLAGESSGMSQANLVQSDLQTVAPYSKYAIKFEAAGGNERIEGIGNTLGNGFSELSISAWVNYSASPGNQYWPIISKSSGNGTSFNLQNMRSGSSSNGGELYFNVHTQNGSFSSFSGVIPSTNVWYNITGTYDGNEVKIYINNVLKGTLPATGTINTNNSQVWIGDSGYGGYSALFQGIMSNISVWNTGLTSSQVTEIYNQGLPGNLNSHSAYSNLVSWWQLGENSSFDGNDWLFADEKGSNNGESVNMTISDLVNGVGTTANGVSSGMSEGNLVGDAPYSTANALSTNMVITSRVSGSGNTP